MPEYNNIILILDILNKLPWHSTIDSKLHRVKKTYQKVDYNDYVSSDVIIHEDVQTRNKEIVGKF